ncbi:hypothetical protein [Yoonia sp.]|uniref:hypothetical protein n=1 Tax=Yoonia sp. TaxID=2212373 RepID=UPI0019EFF10A|nr:hypothetical protein [Yoonia sp.]MBE0413087.1 hypothetical protein [Yoonia sp.]
MPEKTTLKTVLATVAVVVAFVVSLQFARSGMAGTREINIDYTTTVTSTMVVSSAKNDSVFGVPDVATAPPDYWKNVQKVTAIDATYREQAVPLMGVVQAMPSGNCAITLTGSTTNAAMVNLDLSAECQRNAYFVLRHQGLVFSAKTDAAGRATLLVPALAADAQFSVSFQNLEVASLIVKVPEAILYDRAVLQWQGDNILQLHALEFGAKVGDPGHIWSATTSAAERIMGGEHGYITRLGTADADVPYIAEIYTFPSGLMNRVDEISLNVGIFVRPDNCGRKVNATAIQIVNGRQEMSHDLRIPVPSCAAQGRTLLMPHMFQEVKLAAR